MTTLNRLRQIGDTDLNALLKLAVLLRTQSVSKTADYFGISQPAMSRVLERLRHTFADPLLVRTGNAMLLTVRGRQLSPMLEHLLERADELLEPSTAFDPATLARRFAIGCNDHVQVGLIPYLMPVLRREAPNAALDFKPATAVDTGQRMASGQVDILIGSATDGAATLRSQTLYTEDFVCLMRAEGAAASRPLSFERFCSMPHLDVSPTGLGILSRRVDQAAAALGGSRRVNCMVSCYASAPLIIGDTDMICVLPRRIAHQLRLPPGVAVVELDFPAPTMEVLMYWHNVTHHDPACQWLRRTVADCTASHLLSH